VRERREPHMGAGTGRRRGRCGAVLGVASLLLCSAALAQEEPAKTDELAAEKGLVATGVVVAALGLAPLACGVAILAEGGEQEAYGFWGDLAAMWNGIGVAHLLVGVAVEAVGISMVLAGTTRSRRWPPPLGLKGRAARHFAVVPLLGPRTGGLSAVLLF
jgi:hypothetical protein